MSRSNGTPRGVEPIYVAVNPYYLEAGRQMCQLRGVCRVCGWRSKARDTDRVLRPRESVEADQVARETLRHWRNAHPGQPLPPVT